MLSSSILTSSIVFSHSFEYSEFIASSKYDVVDTLNCMAGRLGELHFPILLCIVYNLTFQKQAHIVSCCFVYLLPFLLDHMVILF